MATDVSAGDADRLHTADLLGTDDVAASPEPVRGQGQTDTIDTADTAARAATIDTREAVDTGDRVRTGDAPDLGDTRDRVRTGEGEASDRLETVDTGDRAGDRLEATAPVDTAPPAGARETVSTPDADDSDETPEALVADSDALEARWYEIQVLFVDEPRRAVEDADALVAEVMRQLAESFAENRARMEHDWQAGEDVSTEDLRVALRRYRSFFQRLLAA